MARVVFTGNFRQLAEEMPRRISTHRTCATCSRGWASATRRSPSTSKRALRSPSTAKFIRTRLFSPIRPDSTVHLMPKIAGADAGRDSEPPPLPEGGGERSADRNLTAVHEMEDGLHLLCAAPPWRPRQRATQCERWTCSPSTASTSLNASRKRSSSNSMPAAVYTST